MATKKRALETQSGFGEIRPLDASQWEVSSFVTPDLPKQEKKEEPGNFARGFKKSMYQIPQTIGGTIGLAGDVLGADGMRDYGMGIYENNTKKVEELTRDSDSISNVMEGNGSFGDWLSSGAGYVGGQALGVIGTGGVGALLGRKIAERGVRHLLENQTGREAARLAISKGAKVGAASATFGNSLVQEAGSIYPEAVHEAQRKGVELTAGDRARILGSSIAAASVDTLGTALIANKFLGGGRRAITNSAGEQVSESIGRAALREVPLGMAKEAGTEGIQTVIERYGANQDLSSKEAIRDYVDSAALGALGGAGGGVASSFTKQRLPETGALTRSANAGIDAENASLQTSSQNPAPQPSADLPATQNNPAQQFTGMDELISAVQNEDNPSLVREIAQRQAQQQMDQPSQIEGVPANFSEVLQQSNQQREQDRIEARESWEGAKEQAAIDLAEQDRLEQENRLRLPAPDMPMPEGALIDDNGTLRPQTYQDAAAAQVAAAQREELGQPVPYGSRGGVENVQVPSNDNINSTDVNELPTVILNGQGAPFATKLAAEVRRKQLGKNFSIIPVDGGFAVQNNVPGAKNAVPPAPPSVVPNEEARANNLEALAHEWDISNRSGRNDEWFSGSAESNRAFNSIADEGSAIPAHGMAKAKTLGEALKNLVSMVNNGIDPNKTLYYESLTRSAGTAHAGATPGGVAYRDGPFIVTFREGLNGRQPTGSDITGVLVNPANANLVDDLQQIFPNIVVRSYNDVADVVSASKQKSPSYILHPSGKPFTNKIGAQSRLKQLGGNHTIVPYEGGFAIRNNDPQAVTQVKEQQAASGVPDATAGSAQPEPVAIQPGDIMHPSGKPFTVKYPAIMTQRQSGGEIIKVDGGYIVRPPKQASLEEIVAESQSEPTYEKGKTGAETARNKLDAENPFLSFLGKYGLNIEERSDVGGERGKARLIPGHGPLFRKNGLRLDELAQAAKEAGFLSQEQIDSDTDNGGVNALSDMIGQALNNEVIPKVQSEPEVNPDVEMLNEAKNLGLETTGKTPDQVYDMIKAVHDQKYDSQQEQEWNTAVELFNDLSLEAQELAREYNLHELYFDIEELENAKTNDARSEGEVSQPVTGGEIQTEKIDRGDNETSAKQAEGVDAAEAGSQEAIGGETASKPSGADNATVNLVAPSMGSSSKETDQGTALLSRSNTLGETIEVDGVERPTTNSNGKPIAVNEEGAKNFWRWFGDSKVVDADGKPLVVYHGTGSDISTFDLTKTKFNRVDLSGKTSIGDLYAGLRGKDGGANVMPLYIRIERPATQEQYLNARKEVGTRNVNEYLSKQGFDGVIDGDFYIVFDPTQIKSATGNNGNYDPVNPDIRYSKTRESGQRSKFGFDVDELQPIVDQISSTWKNAPKINIVQTIDDLPFDAPSDARGAYFKKQVYLVAANLRDQAQAEAVLLHETLGHAGLNELFGEKLAPALRSIAMKNRKIAEAAAVWRKGNTDIKGKMSDERYHLVSIEEALADYVGTGRTINGVEKLLAAIQKGLRAIGLNKIADWMENATDAEVLSMLASARKHIEKGSDFSVFGEQQAQAFSRDEKNALSTDTKIEEGNPKALFSRSVITGDNNRTRTPEQLRAFENVGRTVEVPTLKERFNKLTENLGKKLAQGIVDQFAPIKDLSAEAYGLMRLSKGASGAFEAMLKGGQLKLSDGVYDFDDTKRGGVVDRLLVPLQGESDDFMWWVAGNRAESLTTQGKEHLFTTDDIKAFKSLSDGQASFDYTIQHGLQKGKTTRNRATIYADSLKTFNEFNKNTLDMAEQSGLIDPDSRKIWESEFYIPFYRVSEESDDGVRGMNVKSGVVRQQAFKKLKGGTDKLNSDLLENTLMNWAHLLDASAKNRAAKSTLEAAENVGAAMPAMSGDKKTVWYMDNGEKKYFSVEDVHLLAAIQGLEYAGMRSPIMNAMSTMKHAMTMGVTASPFFKVRNLIRDSVSAIGIAGLDYNPGKNIKEGWKLTNPKSDEYFRLLAGGGTIHFGAMLEGSEAKRIRKLVASGVDESTILNSDSAMKSFYRKHVAPAVDAYNELGNRGESINRASLYDQLIKQGKNHAEASLMARDLMDFSMQGAWTSIRFLTQVVPFMNARLQGLYKLGKSAKEDPKRFGTVLGAVAMSSIALMLAYSDDEDWKKREDFDRDNFWWFKFGDTAFRIPKPFEIGAIGTLAERGVEYFTQDEMTGERFMSRFKHLLLDSLSMNPIPQMIKPVIDVYANKDSFTGRPIETMSMERLRSDFRFNGSTSMAARGLSTAGNSVTGDNFLSPVQIDHLIRGYFGWLGSFAVGSADRIVRPFSGEPEKATPDYAKWLSGGMVADTKTASSRYVSQMYEQAKVLDEAYGTWRMLIKTGKLEEAKEFAEDNDDKLRRYKGLQNVKKQATSLNEQVRVIERSNLDADEKREKINLIQQRKDNIARRASL